MTGTTKQTAAPDKPEPKDEPSADDRIEALEKKVESLTKLARLNGWTVKG